MYSKFNFHKSIFFIVFIFFIIKPALSEVKKFRLNLKGYTDVNCPNFAAVDSWYFRGEKIDFESTKKYKLKNNGKTLTIINADVEQEGNYICQFGSKNDSITLSTAPRIHLVEVENCRIDLKSVHAYLGKKFRIDCKSNNQDTKYTMRWLKNGQEIKNEVTNQLTLEINELKESSRANYTCQATNDIGHFNIDFILRVRSSNAYLWPISGIIAEIVILLSAIWYHGRKEEYVSED